MDSELTKPKRGRKKKIDPKINEVEENDVREKRGRLVVCVLSDNPKQYLGKEYTEQQICELDCNNVNTPLNRYESILSAQMTKLLGKSVLNLYSNIACSVPGVGNQQDLRDDLECHPFINTALQRFKATSHLTISMSGQHATGKIQGNNYHHGSCGPSLTGKKSSVSLIFTHETHGNVTHR